MDENDLQGREQFLARVEAYLGRNEPASVLDLARQRLKRIPGDPEARIVQCRAWLLQGRLNEARNVLLEMEEALLTRLARVYSCMGDICIKKDMQDKARTFYQKSILLNPESTPAPGISAGLKDLELPPAAAETNAKEETTEDTQVPDDFQTVTLAELYLRQGHLQEAEKILEKIIGEDPQNETASGLLQELRGRILREASERQYAGVIAELSRWMKNVKRLRNDVA